MAAAAGKKPGADSDSSSSDDEARRRCEEAVWDSGAARRTEGDVSQQSKRVVVAAHEHDGNELQVSQGFRTHVAKKLGRLLDSCISETQTKTSSCVESVKCEADDDEGFRLFSTSVPGQAAEEPPAPVRRRPAPSSSDSDSEMETRLREAAVAVKDLLPSSTLTSTLPTPSREPPCSEKIKKKKKEEVAEGQERHIVKKKKKRKPSPEEQVDCAGSPLSVQSNGGAQELGTGKLSSQSKTEKEKEARRKLSERSFGLNFF